jgi:threonine synthase
MSVTGLPPVVTGLRCATCGTRVEIAAHMSWRCPNATAADPYHVLHIEQPISPLRATPERNPFLAFRRYLAWDAFAAANGVDETGREALITEVDDAVAAIAGTGFHITPFRRADELSTALGFGADGGVWVKDETGQVAGSHKPRHLLTILLHLLTAERCGLTPWHDVADRPPLAIASCGNAAFAASTLAAAVNWPIQVFVPPSANPVVLARLHELRAHIVECPRRAADPPGDPCIHRFREAVAAGAVPFTVQGPENAWCRDGGRTIGWEMARHFEEQVVGPPLDRLLIQVGAGTFAASAIAGFRMSGVMPRLHAVQTDSCAPLARAWEASRAYGSTATIAAHWADCMWPWEEVGLSAADGILDDETYDWLPVVAAMADGNGSPVVASEAEVVRANELAHRTTGINVSATGSAGLAGLLAMVSDGRIDGDQRVAVVFSGVRR